MRGWEHEVARIQQFVCQSALEIQRKTGVPMSHPEFPEFRDRWIKVGFGEVTLKTLEETFRNKCMTRFRRSSEEKRESFLYALKRHGWKDLAESVQMEAAVFP